MTNQAVGIRSLAVKFPSVIHTPEAWGEAFPELAAQAQARVRLPRKPQPGIDQDAESDLATWSQEVAPYLSDPFRGNVERRRLAVQESPRAIECQAAQDAIAAAGLQPDDIELMIASTLFSESMGIGNAPALAQQLGLRCPAWTLESTCSSALVALQTVRSLVQAGEYRTVLVIVSHFGSRVVDPADTLSWAMGDGAGSFIVTAQPDQQGVLATHVMSTTDTCGAYAYEFVTNDQGMPQLRMRTGESAGAIAETAVASVRTCCESAAAKAGISLDQISLFAFNTPTAWYASVCTRALAIPPERVMNLYPRYANIGPVLAVANLYHAAESGRLYQDDLVLVYTHGAGATAAATVMRWGEVALGPKPTAPSRVTPEQETVRLASSLTSLPVTASDMETVAPILTLSRAMVQAAVSKDRLQLVETYLLDWIRRSLPALAPSLSPDQPLATVLDSLMGLTFKSQIEVDLQVRVPMEQFFGEHTIAHLAEYILNQLELSVLRALPSDPHAETCADSRETLRL
ncbi:3-oxoacyl-[acyl-carrier-protein] synthase III C-terminal domain-containing protein [Acaryochloris marina]|nr:3-oxoacyl-[acyl-carrier-protein] synthase III C-terminal domain-containing protein [Acaryochloris marina]